MFCLDHSGNIEGCCTCTLAFVKEFLEEPVSNEQAFNNDFLSYEKLFAKWNAQKQF